MAGVFFVTVIGEEVAEQPKPYVTVTMKVPVFAAFTL